MDIWAHTSLSLGGQKHETAQDVQQQNDRVHGSPRVQELPVLDALKIGRDEPVTIQLRTESPTDCEGQLLSAHPFKPMSSSDLILCAQLLGSGSF